MVELDNDYMPVDRIRRAVVIALTGSSRRWVAARHDKYSDAQVGVALAHSSIYKRNLYCSSQSRILDCAVTSTTRE